MLPKYALCDPWYPRNTLCQPVDLTNTCTSHLYHAAMLHGHLLLYHARHLIIRKPCVSPATQETPSICPATSPTHVPGSNSTLPSSIVPSLLSISCLRALAFYLALCHFLVFHLWKFHLWK